jgi:hypothetical protein
LGWASTKWSCILCLVFHDVSLFSQKKQRSYKIFRIKSHRMIGGVEGGRWFGADCKEKNDSQICLKSCKKLQKKNE